MRAFPSFDRYDQDGNEEDHDAEGHIRCIFSLQAENMIGTYRLPRLTHSVGFEKVTYNHSSNDRLAKNALYTPAGGRASTRRFPQRIVCYSNCEGEEENICISKTGEDDEAHQGHLEEGATSRLWEIRRLPTNFDLRDKLIAQGVTEARKRLKVEQYPF